LTVTFPAGAFGEIASGSTSSTWRFTDHSGFPPSVLVACSSTLPPPRVERQPQGRLLAVAAQLAFAGHVAGEERRHLAGGGPRAQGVDVLGTHAQLADLDLAGARSQVEVAQAVKPVSPSTTRSLWTSSMPSWTEPLSSASNSSAAGTPPALPAPPSGRSFAQRAVLRVAGPAHS